MANRYLKSLRSLKGLIQQDMADLLGVTIQTYNKKENGKAAFTAEEYKNMAELFEVPIENLMTKFEVSNQNSA
jgi:transcriptional regulator with XRE-family HTH domain